jgi:hypothetical protein
MEAIFRSLQALRGHFTRTINALTSTVDGADKNPNAHSEEAIMRAIRRVEAARDTLENKCMHTLELPDCNEERSTRIEGYLADMADRMNAAFRRADEVLIDLHPVPVQQAPPPAAAAPAPRPKICDALKPFRLKHDSYPNDLRLWRESYDAFYHASALNTYTVEQQHAFFFSCMNSQLATRVREHDLYRINLATFGDVDSLMARS